MKRNEFSASCRLGACAAFVRQGSRLADIGTDHALLPIRLVEDGKVPCAIAADINEGPISRARANIREHGLEDKITTVVCDGLAKIDPGEVDDIVIAGMGGELIFSIISGAPWLADGRYRLILQPMTRPERLRTMLYKNGFEIISERAVTDAGKYYSVMCVYYTGIRREPDSVFAYSGLLYEQCDDAASCYLLRHAAAIRREADGISVSGRTEEAKEKYAVAEALEAMAGRDK